MSDGIPILDWHGLYSGTWKGVITEESFTHPAKFASELARKMFRHGLERGFWKAGDLVGDPFGGIGGGGIWATWAGLRWIGVELEPRFVAMARDNFRLHERGWRQMRCELPTIVQGDSRMFAELVGGSIAGAVTSPPYGDQMDAGGPDTPHPDGATRAMHGRKDRYGSTPGQISKLSGIVTSPPYSETLSHGSGPVTERDLQGGKSLIGIKAGYGSTPGQIGKLSGVVTSPPWENQEGANAAKKHADPEAVAEKRSRQYASGEIGGNYASKEAILKGLIRANEQVYGQSEGQLGNQSGDTYWQAMAQVYASVYQSLKPGGVMACVVKDYVKNKARVPLCDTTLELLISTGFEPIERCRAWLTKETREAGLHEEIVTTKSRKSFFRRLAEKKGSPAIDWEEVLWIRKPI